MPRRYSFEADEAIGADSHLDPPAHIASRNAHQTPNQTDNTFERLRQNRRESQAQSSGIPDEPMAPPAPPPHGNAAGRRWDGEDLGYTESRASYVTQGADNFGPQAAGGVTGIALSVADARARDSGLRAARQTPGYRETGISQSDLADELFGTPRTHQTDSQSSLVPLGGAAAAPATARSSRSYIDDPYEGSPYRGLSGSRDVGLGALDPSAIVDDGDDGLDYTQHGRHSLLPASHGSRPGSTAGAVGGAAAGGVMGAIGGLVGRSASGNHAAQYDPVYNSQPYQGYDVGREAEKSEWLNHERKSSNKWRWILGAIIALIVVGAIAGGVAGHFVSKSKSSKSSSSSTANSDTATNGDLTKDSPEIKALLNNTKLHKVFPGIDYTPINTQFPDCLANPPSQNNVTRDLAVLSQLSNAVRLYGTDCNQTEMVLHSIDALGLNGTLKVWLGVWQSTNETTNARQLSQMYDILAKYGTQHFKGAIVGNEVIFREDKTIAELGAILSGVRSNFTSLGYNLSVSTSDIGASWTASLARDSDLVMANIHPFFAGVPASQGAAWTWTYWHNNIYSLNADLSKNYISETGWPSTGGTDCGSDLVTSCPDGAVAGVAEMNTFFDDFVCQALRNGTQYFMFEAFDEPWKVMYDNGTRNWEDHWGLLTVDRQIKSGVVLPDCGGETVPVG